MYKDIILELAGNGVDYLEGIQASKKPEYEKHSDELYGLLEKLCESLPEEERIKTINQIFNAQAGLEYVTANEYFKAGFKLGLTLAAQNFLD